MFPLFCFTSTFDVLIVYSVLAFYCFFELLRHPSWVFLSHVKILLRMCVDKMSIRDLEKSSVISFMSNELKAAAQQRVLFCKEFVKDVRFCLVIHYETILSNKEGMLVTLSRLIILFSVDQAGSNSFWPSFRKYFSFALEIIWKVF